MAITTRGEIMTDNSSQKKIVAVKDGPYVVTGDLLLVRKEQVVSEYGEPLTWRKTGRIETKESYDLCRCGHSKELPYCDNSHYDVNFDGTETADTNTTGERRIVIAGGTNIVVMQDCGLCSESGFCGNRITNIIKMTPHTDDTQVRAQVMAMIERCPSGAYSFALEEGGEDIEPDFPQEIAATVEITSDGPINGPLWVTGNIPLERSDGEPIEARNRVTLCCCGESKNKPLCDGSHRKIKR
jgi:CDGSH-type Zn-finger protein